MSSSVKTILIIGATSGIGEAFARRFHQSGKKFILAGRREDRLKKLQQELPGAEIRLIDSGNFEALPRKVEEVIKSFPDLNTFWVNAGIQRRWNVTEPLDSSSINLIEEEIRINSTSLMVLARLFIPHLMLLGSEANWMVTASGLAFSPMMFPAYCATKAAAHSFTAVTRQQLQGTNVNVIEHVPPYVDTELNGAHKHEMTVQPMSLAEFTASSFEILDNNDARDLKEVAVGSAGDRVNMWRSTVGAMLEKIGIGG